MRILCAVRGGPRSQGTVTRAVELARERDAALTFVYVVDVEFLGYATAGRPRVMLKELRSTGEFMMEILRNRVAPQGIDVDSIVRTGDVRRQITESVRWQDAGVLVIGRPVKGRGGHSTFTEKSLAEFVEQIEAQTGVEVIAAETSTAPAEVEKDDAVS
ncbi:MAG: hypothetical protein MAG451_01992 [Anaerolineales bacterium]|nr:hypothetical protein [Anaerolineales bacterium]